ncbi:MAG: CopG family transcriptional regulator [Candidatus Omnitrophica bacterium]|nr:CopG family transcriptional regulator [Candidatus Omnitrophota bacterium]
MITLRLDPKTEKQIKATARELGMTQSDLIRKSIDLYLESLDQPSPWDLGKEVFGKHSSGLGNLSEDRKAILKSKLRAKRG